MDVMTPREHRAAPAGAGFHELIHVTTTRDTEFVDLTDRLASLVARSGLAVGFLNLQALHTTTGIVVNEHEPLLLSDFAATLELLAPRRAPYEHDRFDRRTVNLTPDERVNGHAHCRALVLGASVCLNVADHRLILGRWQRVFLAELDGPRERTLSAVLIGHASQGPAACTRTSWIESRFSEALDR